MKHADAGRSVVVHAWPAGPPRFHLILLLAGTWVIRLCSKENSWYWVSRLTVVLRRLFPRGSRVSFRIFGARLIEVALSDDYWMPSVLLGHENEPEVLAVLSELLSPESVFIDAGANIGWWSLFASTRINDASRVIAIEPAESTFLDLQSNAQRNGSAFTCLQAAVWDKAGEVLPLRFSHRAREGAYVASHEAWSGSRYEHTELVPSVCIDDIVDAHAKAAGPLILKLDVEGAELKALDGITRHIDRFNLIIYEDHGREPTARVTEEILRLGFAVFSCDRYGNKRQICSALDAQAMKRDLKRGYNFFALRTGV